MHPESVRYALWRTCPLAFTLAVVVASQPACFAHPFHISTAEIEFNRQTKRFEVSLKLHAADIENALSARVGKRVNVEKAALPKALTQYLNENFLITTKAAKDAVGEDAHAADNQTNVKMVGHELKTSWLWLYFELELPSKKSDIFESGELVIRNSMLIDTVKGQINTVAVRHGKEKTGLRFDRKTTWLEFSPKWLDAL